jgi:GNAT superfamily N-acetyltransferase
VTDDPRIRAARPDDLPQIASFTADTFEWGDYVADAFDEWLDDDRGHVMVAEVDGRVIGLGRVVLLSDREAWLHAARVHPDHRRSGIGAALNDHGCDWARARGAVVARLMTEDWNEPAIRQVTKLGYRRTASWAWAERRTDDGEVDPRTNGGRRVPGEERLTPGGSAEAEPAWIAWSTGELAVTGRQLYPIGWHFRTMTIDDVTAAARRRALWQCPSGWVVADVEDDGWHLSWVVTNDLDADRLLRAVLDRAQATSLSWIRVMVPRVAWMEDALRQAGFELHPAGIYALGL